MGPLFVKDPQSIWLGWGWGMNLGNLFEEREIQEKLMVFDKCNLTFK